jgi:hypothetical protein
LKSIFSKVYFFDLESYGTNPTISYGGFDIVSKAMHKNSKKCYAIKRIALNKEESEKAFKDLKLMKGLKSGFVIEHIDSWIEENALKFEDFNNTSASDKVLRIQSLILKIQFYYTFKWNFVVKL